MNDDNKEYFGEDHLKEIILSANVQENKSDRIILDGKNFQKFALSDNKREVHVGKKFGTKLAIAGSENTITSGGEQTHTAVSGNNSKIYIQARSSVTAVAGKFLTTTIVGKYTRLAMAGEYGKIGISGECSGTAVCSYMSAVHVEGNHHYVALCESNSVHIKGDYNQIAIVGDGPFISCCGTGNRVSSIGINATFKGKIGNWFSLSDYDDNENFVGFVTGCIGQNGLKPDVRYCARRGQFFEMFDR